MDLAVLIDTIKKAVTPLGTPHRVLLTKVDTRSLAEAQEAKNTLGQWRGNNGSKAESDHRCVVDELKPDWRKLWLTDV